MMSVPALFESAELLDSADPRIPGENILRIRDQVTSGRCNQATEIFKSTYLYTILFLLRATTKLKQICCVVKRNHQYR